MNAPAIRPAARPLHALTFRAWRVGDDGQKRVGKSKVLSAKGRAEAHPLTIGAVPTLAEAVNAAAPQCQHKDTLLVLQDDAGRNQRRLHCYTVKRDSTPSYGGAHGLDRFHPLYASHLFDVEVTAFDPAEPWGWTPGADVVGRDASLVEVA